MNRTDMLETAKINLEKSKTSPDAWRNFNVQELKEALLEAAELLYAKNDIILRVTPLNCLTSFPNEIGRLMFYAHPNTIQLPYPLTALPASEFEVELQALNDAYRHYKQDSTGEPDQGGAIKLKAIGEALYGRSWQAQLADDLGVDRRRITHWLDGTRSIPAGVWGDLKIIAARRKAEVNAVVTD